MADALERVQAMGGTAPPAQRAAAWEELAAAAAADAGEGQRLLQDGCWDAGPPPCNVPFLPEQFVRPRDMHVHSAACSARLMHAACMWYVHVHVLVLARLCGLCGPASAAGSHQQTQRRTHGEPDSN